MSKYFKIHAYILIFYAVFSIYTTFSLFAIETADTDGVSYEDESGESSFDEGSFVNLGVDDDGVSIIGTPETTQQIKTIDADEIKRRQPPDLATLLEESLDMGITRYGAYGNQTEINMRGFDTERIAVLIDGVPANSPRSGEFDVNQIDISNVERVEVIYGGSDSKYNVTGAMGGVINIITIKKQKTGVHFGGSVSNTSYVPGRYNKLGGAIGEADFSQLVDTQMLNFSLGYGAEKFSFKANWFGNHASNQYLYRDYGGFARRKESNAVLDTGGGVSFVWDLPNLVKLFSTTNFYYADRQYPVTGTSAGFAKEYDFSAKQSLMLDAPLAFRDDLSTELSLTYTFAQMKYGAASRSDDGYVTAVNRWNWYQGDKFTLRAGLDLRVINVDSTEDGVRSGGTGGIFAAAEWMPSKRLMVIASVKEASDFRQAVAVPKAGFVWRINDNLSLKNNYFRSFKFPDFDDMFYHSADGLYAGNPDLKPEDGLGADFGMEFSGEGVFGVSGAAYVQYTTDSIHWVKRAGRWMPQNAGTGFFTGAELRPSLTFNFQDGAKSGGFITVNKIKVSPTYQFQLSWLLNEGLGFDNGMRIPYMPTHIIGCSFDIQFEAGAKKEAGSLLVSAHWESRRYADTQNIMELPPYCLVNITLNQNIGSRFTAFFIVRNVLNQLYTSFAEYPMPGMSITAGLRVNL